MALDLQLLYILETPIINKKETILFFLPFWYTIRNLVDYFDSLNSFYNIIYTSNESYACTINPDKVLFVFEISNLKVSFSEIKLF